MTAARILLTGATGFVGHALAHRLRRDNHEVHLLVRPHSDRTGLADGDFTFHVHQGGTEQLCEILRLARPDAVFHLASLFLAQHGTADVQRLIDANVLFPTQLAEAMAVNDVRLLVNTGTSWQHFENADYNPVGLYAATKQAFEALLRHYVESAGLRTVTLKLFDTYGPGDRRPKLLHLLARAAEQGTTLPMSGGAQLIDMVHIDDVTEAFMLAFERLRNGTQQEAMATYAVSSGAPLSLRDLAALYAHISGRELDIEWGGRPYRPREVMVPWTNHATVPGWQPRIGLAEGFARLLRAPD